ncbi:MAG TPA: gephyrin-like molybdotransferase Glp [Vicinamibacterales bacterium]|nr:gephyrin-like molybdotransferase Glp [Vicinamibacterales bacterium]
MTSVPHGSMRPIRDTVPLEEALALALAAAAPVTRIEAVPLDQSDGRVLARDLMAPIDVPSFDRAAMDGFAVVAEDTFGAGRFEPKVLRCVEKVFTGQVAARRVTRGECIEIATGAPMPAGADAVVMVEETERSGVDVRVLTPVYPGQNVGRRAADIKRGHLVLRAGTVLNPGGVGAAAAVGLAAIEVFARPSVALLSTGNEIVEPGAPLALGQIYDINRFTLAAIVRRHGGEPVAQPLASDAVPDLNAAIDAALDSDLIVFSGGSSVGERDLILDVLRARGEVVFHGIAVKPGKPTVFGRIATPRGDTPVLGMPGNPTSCLSNAYMLLVPMLRRMAQLPPHDPQTVRLPLARRIVSTTGRHQFYTVRIADGAAHPAFKASGDITSMADADGYIEIPAQTDLVEAGEIVTVKLF